ncbi:50S ribosomal protein L29 [soil metagenome]|jgi:large subunit ribosomal protein L29
MDIDKVRALTDAELEEELRSQRQHLYDLRFQLATRQLTDHNQLAQTRRTIARILTVATERQADGADSRPKAAAAGRGGKR